MRVSLIGMSNIGKSHWATRIAADTGCDHIHCDALIEEKLRPELAQNGYEGLHGMARWMGLPAAPQHKQHSAMYVAFEREVMREILDRLRNPPEEAAIIDTTGSVIYTGDDILAELAATTKVIYFEASEAHTETLFKHYIANPKPTIWGDLYAPLPGESERETLKRCYPLLLRERARRYRALAHVTIPFEQHKAHSADIGTVIRELAKHS